MRRALALLAGLCVAGAAGAADWRWQLPPGFPPPAVPGDNPMSAPKVALGRRLFFDAGLSANGALACASCHQPSRAYSDGRVRPRGVRGELLPHNAPSLANVAYMPVYGWSAPGVPTLEMQMRQPLFAEHPVEMGLAGREPQVLAQLQSDPLYRAAFAAAFPGEPAPVTMDNLIRAIACFERTLLSGRSAFDRYVFDDDRSAMSEAAKRGMALFYAPRTGCADCHGGLAFSGTLRATGSEAAEPVYAATGVAPGRFKVPGLRNVALTAPYMHDGSLPSLEAVIDFYDRGGGQRQLRPLALRAEEKDDLVAFLRSLTDPDFVSPP